MPDPQTEFPRVAILEKYHQQYVYYTQSSKNNERRKFRFGTMADMFIMAALMGFYLKRPKSLENEKLEKPIKWDVFMNNEAHMHIIKSICLLHIKKDPKKAVILLKNTAMAKVIEQYANGGIAQLLKDLDGPDIEGNMIAMINQVNRAYLRS